MLSGRRKRGGQSRDLWIVATLGVLAAALTPLLFGSNVEPGARPTRPQSDLPRPASSEAARPVAAGRPVAPQPRVVELTLTPPYEVADGLTIVSETRRVRLAGLEGPASEAACFDPQGRLWACGLQARAALYNLIRSHVVACQASVSATTDISTGNCSVGAIPLDRALVQQGFARPLEAQTGLADEMDAARTAGRGLWNGGWRLRP